MTQNPETKKKTGKSDCTRFFKCLHCKNKTIQNETYKIKRQMVNWVKTFAINGKVVLTSIMTAAHRDRAWIPLETSR